MRKYLQEWFQSLSPDDRSSPVVGPPQRWLLLAGFALLVIFRLPHAWAHGRFLDEEATVFLAYAWHHPWFDALFRPFAGYLNLGANATTLIVAGLVKRDVVSLEHAPYLTMTIALAVQLLPAALILTGRASWLSSRQTIVAALLLLAIAPGTEEVFLNVMHIQFHLALCVALILALDLPQRSIVRVGYAVLLLVAPLCGPLAIVILPFFALRALVDRDRDRWMQFLCLAVGAALQMLLFYGHNPTRGHLLGPGTLAAVLAVRLLVTPALGFGKSHRIGDAIYDAQLSGTHDWWWAAAMAIAFFGALVVLAARRRDAAIWLVLPGLTVAAVSFGYGMVIVDPRELFSVTSGERYNFLPLVLLSLSLVALAMRQGARGRPVYAFLVLLVLFTGAYRYSRPMDDLRDGPSWSAEVAAWRQDHRHPLAVWPRPYAADLSDQTRPCLPSPPDPALSTDPRYCESGWVGSFYRYKKRREAEEGRAGFAN